MPNVAWSAICEERLLVCSPPTAPGTVIGTSHSYRHLMSLCIAAGGARRIPLGRGAGSRPGTAAGRSEHSEDVSVVALSRQLVQCKMAEADAQRKLR